MRRSPSSAATRRTSVGPTRSTSSTRADALVDRLTYNDQLIGGPRTINLSANIALANLGLNRADLAVASFVGDAYGSTASTATFPGNPGQYLPIPEPGTALLMGLGLVGLAAGSHRAGARGRVAGEASR